MSRRAARYEWRGRALGRMMLASLGAPIGVALALARCGTDAVGIDACRKIEDARCEGAKACGFTSGDVEHCKEFYRDQCLHGIENVEHTPTQQETDACVAAVQATGACGANGITKMSACAAAPVSADAANATPCDILLNTPEKLVACAFVAIPPDASIEPDAPADGDASDDGSDATTMDDAGDASG